MTLNVEHASPQKPPFSHVCLGRIGFDVVPVVGGCCRSLYVRLSIFRNNVSSCALPSQ